MVPRRGSWLRVKSFFDENFMIEGDIRNAKNSV